jgi:MoxR-like ATPase
MSARQPPSPETAATIPLGPSDASAVERHAATLALLRQRLHEQVVGQEAVVHQILATLLSEGHGLVVGVPGLAKTLLVRTLAALLSLDFRRIQFTPDLMPSDITGATVVRRDAEGHRAVQFLQGPVFTNLLLADEINRTPPKSQAALMEAMEERQVTAGGRRMPLDRPFFVLATQNPIEQQGTYPLPVSQLDRFLLRIEIDYPENDEEFQIVLRTTSTYRADLAPCIAKEEILEMIHLARRVTTTASILDYASRIVRRTRPAESEAPATIRENVAWGAGPRAVQSLIAASRAIAFLAGRTAVTDADIHAIAHPVLRHRLVLGPYSEADGVSPEHLIDDVLESFGRFERPSARVTATKRRTFWDRLLLRGR